MDRKALADTSQKLRELLLEPDYACRWQARIGRRQAHALHQSGICQVLAEYMWANGLESADDELLPRKLKDRVYRALGGNSLSLATLRWFTEAFEMKPGDTATLLHLTGSAGAGGTLIGARRALVRPGVLPPRRHRTVSLKDCHRIGPDGLPESHRTVQVIRAEEDLDRYPCVFDTDAASFRVVRGGRCGEPYAVGDGLYAVDILLNEPLRAGQATLVEYETTFWYRTPPPPEFRRATVDRISNVDMRVQFHHLRLPRRVWSSEWSALDAPPAYSESVELDAEKSVHRNYPALDHTVVGFRWEIARPGR
ncbi:MAG: hypothetical protein QM619_07265 [Micropruina sp.]|uniref:hypothetical protein n=1 Tax=Micropruina sp. TaxID=2737536 RepID=UPI0039E285E8